jgi:anti-sigma regulatory factor (Ser/Thr protein kinase)
VAAHRLLSGGGIIAVTTHSRTKGLRYALPVLLAARRIERELEHAPGCERHASVIAGPRELWTLTIWRDAADMRECMRGGAHGAVIWKQPSWLDSYWGMRWRPGQLRSGEWEGPAELPAWIRSALGRTVPLEERKLAGVTGATYRLRVPTWAFPAALRDLRRLRRAAAADSDSFKQSLGLGTGAALYLLVIARSPGALDRLRATPEHKRVLDRWRDRVWCSSWEPEVEFGEWKSRRLRDGQLAGEPLLVDAELPADPDSAGQARDVLAAVLRSVDQPALETLQLLTSELVGNSARHAGLAPADRIGLQVSTRDDCVRVEVVDHGRRFEPRVPVAKSPEDGSGWGLFMVNETAERWGINYGPRERHVWFELRSSRSS